MVVTGGAGSLEVSPWVRLVDSPGFPEVAKPNALSQAAALENYRGVEDLDWTNISPAAVIEAREPSGSYRSGGDQLLTDEHEQNHALRRRITLAY